MKNFQILSAIGGATVFSGFDDGVFARVDFEVGFGVDIAGISLTLWLN